MKGCPLRFEANLVALGRLADELKGVQGIDVEPYIPYGVDKAKKLGITVYEAPRPPVEYGANLAKKLTELTKKPVRLG